MRAKSAWIVTFALGVCLVGLVVAANLSNGATRGGYFNADHVYIAAMYEDLTRWGGRFTDWNFTPAPYFFPDMALYGAARAVTSSIETAQYATDLLQLICVIFVAYALLRRVLPDHASEAALIAPFMVGWVLALYEWAYPFIGSAMAVACHGGGLLSTLIVFALCLRPPAKLRTSGAVAVAVISALTAGSDALFFASCSLPLAAAVLWFGPLKLWRRTRVAPWSRLSLRRCALGAVSGVAGLWFSRSYGFAHAEVTNGSLELAFATWARIRTDPDELAKQTILALGCVNVLALLVVAVTWRHPHRAGLRVLAFWQLAISSAVVGAYLYNGAHFDRWTLRYLVTPCNLAFIFVVALVICSLENAPATVRTSPWPARILAIATIALFVGAVTQASALVTTSYTAPQRPAAECIAELAESEGVTAILGEYWVAKPLMLLSDNRAHVIQVTPSLKPNFWISSRGWYRPPLAMGMLITNGLDMSAIGKVFGLPQAVAQCGGFQVFLYQGASRVRMTFRMQNAFDKELVVSDADRKLGWDRATAEWFGAQSSR